MSHPREAAKLIEEAASRIIMMESCVGLDS